MKTDPKHIGTVATGIVADLARRTGRAVEAFPVTDRASWLARRAEDVTASDVAAICGADPYRTPLRVYAEKTGLIGPTADNNLLRRGRWLEPAVIEALRDVRPTWDIRRAGVYLRDTSINIGATPDAVATDPERDGIGNVQCKVVSRTSFEREWIDGRAPLRYELQALTEAMLLDASWAMVAALVITTHSAELVEHPVPRHDGAEARVRETVERFWTDARAGRQPAPNYASDADIINALYRDPTAGLSVDLSTDNRIRELLEHRTELKMLVGAGEKKLEAIDAEIKAKLGSAEEAHLPGWRLSWKAQTRAPYVVSETTFRVLRVTDKREKGQAA